MPGMQFPYPRKSSTTTTYSSARAATYRQKRTLKTYGAPIIGLFCLLCMILLLLRNRSTAPWTTDSRLATTTAGDNPRVVIVTTLDPKLSDKHKEDIMDNRKSYAQRHGYATFFPNTTDYDLLPKTPHSWSTIPALRHAMTVYPNSGWLWYLSSTALIMDPRESLQDKILEPRTLEKHMITDQPVVPPDSVIKTFKHLRGDRVDFIVSQDKEGLAGESLLIRTGDWAKFFLDAWFDPLYRSYNFQKAEGHALEHMVQWHGTVLARLALIPQRILNSYTDKSGTSVTVQGLYQEGDFIANFHGCQRLASRNCEEEMQTFMSRWRELRDQGWKR